MGLLLLNGARRKPVWLLTFHRDSGMKQVKDMRTSLPRPDQSSSNVAFFGCLVVWVFGPLVCRLVVWVLVDFAGACA